MFDPAIREKMEKDRPSLLPIGRQAIEVWNFCEGWHPERFPMALAYIDVEDVDALIGLLLWLRSFMQQRADFERRVAELQRQTRGVH